MIEARVDGIWPLPEGWTVADVDALPETGLRYELIDGVPYARSPPNGRHQIAVRRLVSALEARLPDGMTALHGLGLVLADDQRPIPDVMVMTSCDDEMCNVPAAQVVVAAEVVSRSSRSDDRFRKPALYAEAGIPVYLRVELDPTGIFAYELVNGVYKEVGHAEAGQTLELATPFPFTIDPAVLIR